jgi:hypothetical protein
VILIAAPREATASAVPSLSKASVVGCETCARSPPLLAMTPVFSGDTLHVFANHAA